VSTHVIEVGPSTIRHLCCGRTAVIDSEMIRTAFESIDDPVALLSASPVTTESLWSDVLRTVDCGSAECVTVVHPSWWASTRIDVINSAANILADDIVIRPRSWLLAQASSLKAPHATVVVEIADRVVAVSGATVVAQPRRGESEHTARALVCSIVRSVIEMTPDLAAAVVIDAPSTVNEASALATMIADGLRISSGMTVICVGDVQLRELAVAAVSSDDKECESQFVAATGDSGRYRGLVLVVLLIAAALGVSVFSRHSAPVTDRVPTTLLVEGRVALEVPIQWPTQRVIAGPGSARVRVTSPSDPEVSLHITQSVVAAETLGAMAESLKHAIDAEPAGIFVDFNPADLSAGRPAVTYREVRAGHDIRWIVLLDRAVRISVGCQSRTGEEDAVREVCDRAVRSARALT
jgi:type VII secretion-associated protein (TIGR03931 family)